MSYILQDMPLGHTTPCTKGLVPSTKLSIKSNNYYPCHSLLRFLLPMWHVLLFTRLLHESGEALDGAICISCAYLIRASPSMARVNQHLA